MNKRFSKGLGWGIIDNISGTGINFIVGILLARALSPEDFSVIGVSMLLVTISNIISDGGISTALVRKTAPTIADFNTAFTVNLCTSIGVYCCLFVIAPYLSHGLNTPILSKVIRSLGLIIIISALSIVPKSQLTRDINFSTQALASSSSSILGAIVALTLIYQGYGIWSFVVQQIVRQTIYTLVLWSVIKHIPRFGFSSHSARNLFSFGSRLLIAGLIDAFYNNVYFYFLGKTYNSHHLGLYSRSDQFSVGLVANFSLVLQRVSLPALAQIKHDKIQFSENFKQLYNKTTIFALLFSGFIAATSDNFVLLLIGNQWKESIMIIKILAISALFQPLIVLYQNVLQVYGKSKLYLNIEVARKLIAIVLVSIGIATSFTFLLFTFTGIALTSWLLYGHYASKHLNNNNLLQGAEIIFKHLLPTALICFLVYKIEFATSSHLVEFILQSLVFMVLSTCYLLVIFPTSRKTIISRISF